MSKSNYLATELRMEKLWHALPMTKHISVKCLYNVSNDIPN